VFILGPSGVGKTTLARALRARLGFLWYEVDLAYANGVTFWGLRPEWDQYLDSAHVPPFASKVRMRIAAAGCAGAVLSLPSNVLLSPYHILVARDAGIEPILLYGPPEECLLSFLTREACTGRGLPREHWEHFDVWSSLDCSDLQCGDYCLSAFSEGERRPTSELMAEVCARLGVQP
jgi:hypothetical protein